MLVTLTLVRYPKKKAFYGLLSMALHRLPMARAGGCRFWKLLGCGKNGSFDLSPDWQQWGLLAVWDAEEDFRRFQAHSRVSHYWQKHAEEQFTLFLEPLSSQGSWSGRQPFGKPANAAAEGPLVVLTRARIRLNRLKEFWDNVPAVAERLQAAPGLRFSVGIGEAPVFLQATLSVWDSAAAMQDFAYRGERHADVIRKTRKRDWYSEELFARFRLLGSEGSLHHTNPLAPSEHANAG